MYDEMIVEPMRRELTRLGIEETRTVAEVDAVLGQKNGTVLVVVNSVCGCAAGMARPAVAMALEGDVKPDRMITVFAGNDREATQRAREYFAGFRPSSPAIALMKDGQVVKMLERWQIEGRHAHDIAAELTAAFREHCATPVSVQ
ncbi:MAG: BrxA/BrxB family bacilliredoxin [Acidobacteria bacterium]|nr:BrxA/BrxB family bacilliredoxin [Acidobacteriota bacterium]MBV9475033.1 BrxA/BrxB family bacilliredoxin [Acidobacteriota bacterium]